MAEDVPAPHWRRRFRKAVFVALAALIGIPALSAIGLAVWDGGANLDPRRTLVPGVAIDLRTVETTRGPIEYDLYGTTGPVVLSVHAGLGGADQGRLFASWLQDDGFRILSPSRPGYLGTPISSGRTLDEQADLLAALLDELGIDRVGVFAVSAGGPVGYTFAARHPHRVWGLVSISGVSLPDPDAETSSPLRATFMNAIGQKVAKLTASASLESIVSGTLDETSTFTAEQKAERVDYIVRTKEVRRFFSAMFDATFPYEKRMSGTDNDAWQTRTMDIPFGRIAAPTLIVHGTRDGDVPFVNGENAAAHIRGAQRQWLPDEDHLAFWLSPRAGDAQRGVRAFLHEHAARD
ncbi:alpha/beta hydrolase [Micromonospora sp. DR5-3]|uniref:alpha/beta fold hydrolase n=1 Tax=unclassified Micromonospora TaxID=2617518 RepID=UPI0011D69602|nr:MULTISPECIES: alpha/beta hydrolase [unclassified Micromonospora]MCW3814736.1 alpha/beta hydrolase [Micromonospora sp. DR5-3]TYC23522.1 alpha/beta hydrolase [Micromonospora sp. MP36]